ncbi:MAG: PLDc N-terminal domain-containing protein [Mycobacteriales bacterium]
MLYGGGLASLIALCLVVYCAINVITSPDDQVRNLPKLLWLLLVLLFPVVGGVAWLVAGRPQGPPRTLPYQSNTGIPPEYDRPGRATARSPDDDEAFLRRLRERAEEQRRKAEQERRERENGAET